MAPAWARAAVLVALAASASAIAGGAVTALEFLESDASDQK